MQTSQNTVLITGGSAGIGLALAQKFLEHNNQVIIMGRNLAKLKSVQQENPELIIHQADITRSADIAEIVAKFPDVNILINNAGVQFNYAIADEGWGSDCIDAEIDTNLRGPLHLIRAYLPHLQKHPYAAIINLTSGMSVVPKENAAIYSATKAALRQYTKALRWQLENTSIKVFEVIPSLVATEMTEGRGANKITPDQLAAEFWQGFTCDQYEIRIGKIKQLFLLNRFWPRLAEKLIRHR